MKFYFILLTVLHIVRVFLVDVADLAGRVLDLASGALTGADAVGSYYLMGNELADVALFTLCLVASYEHGFSRQVLRRMDPRRWRMVGQATLALGVFQAFLFTRGEVLGAPVYLPDPGVLDLARLFLPYVLFAIPAIVHSSERAKSQPA